jgi:membrane-bound ClpP family serine protease
MSIGTGIVLFVIGAILTFALNFETGFINLDLVGYILMAAGAIVFVIGLVLMLRKRQSVTTIEHGVDASGASVSQRRTSTTPPTDVT